MTKLHDTASAGQSIWYDNISRELIDTGELKTLVAKGIRGVTSNPSILEKAIAGSSDYDKDITLLTKMGLPAYDIYEALVIEDIGRAADILHPVFVDTEHCDGYVSIEVSPTLSNDAKGTVEQARHLFHTLNRPNIMIKVPATRAGIEALEILTGEGININVTLIFNAKTYESVANSYLSGLEQLKKKGSPLSHVASVASVFVSRIDAAVDTLVGLDEKLQGKVAIANAKVSYNYFQRLIDSDRWKKLEDEGAHPQRLLWASTGTKNPDYKDTIYVDSLIGPYTVNTVPPKTLDAFLDHGIISPVLGENISEAQKTLDLLAERGISLEKVTDELQVNGLEAFTKAFEALMEGIKSKANLY
jgi:transaldolase